MSNHFKKGKEKLKNWSALSSTLSTWQDHNVRARRIQLEIDLSRQPRSICLWLL